MVVNNLNRIKVMLAERNLTNKWLAGTLGKDCTTVSKWCTNTTQPRLEIQEAQGSRPRDRQDTGKNTADIGNRNQYGRVAVRHLYL